MGDDGIDGIPHSPVTGRDVRYTGGDVDLTGIIPQTLDAIVNQLQNNADGHAGMSVPSQTHALDVHTPERHTYVGFKVNDGTNTQSITTGAGVVLLTWQAEEWDTHNGFATNAYTIPAGMGGKWQFTYQVEYDSSTHGNRATFAVRNDGVNQVVSRTVLHAVTGGAHSTSPPIVMTVAAGDVIDVTVQAHDETVVFKGTVIQSWFEGHFLGV
jgi:hypothetical protein